MGHERKGQHMHPSWKSEDSWQERKMWGKFLSSVFGYLTEIKVLFPEGFASRQISLWYVHNASRSEKNFF